MAAAIRLRADYSADDLRGLAKASRDAKQTRRLLAQKNFPAVVAEIRERHAEGKRLEIWFQE